MDPTFLSLLIFVIITIFYYIFKPKITIDILDSQDPTLFKQLSSKKYMYLFIYLSTVLLSQFFINAVILITKCGGSVGKNIGAGFVMTFIPWVFIFGTMILVLIMFPGFKSAFSNVIGYFVVSGSATELLTKLLINTEIQPALQDDSGVSQEEKTALQKSAEAVVKLCGNISIIINQIVPENFNEYWSILLPLMKPEYKVGGSSYGETSKIKEKFLNLVIMRDDVGESLWYCYTAVLLISVVQYNLTSRGCINDAASMAVKHQEFITEEEKQTKKQDSNSQTLYVV
jgi:hypothetical protein